MPANYTHYRFGVQMLAAMPADLARVVKRYRRLYDIGLHGPDIFFYNPLLKKKYGRPGPYFHLQSGKEFFTRACRAIRMNPSEPATAYLYGILCHYSLDSVFHPYITQEAETKGDHLSMETEFDRYLLEQDGKTPPHTIDISSHIKLTPKECEVVASFFPGISGSDINFCIKTMATVVKTLAVPDGTRRKALEASIRAGGATASSILMSHGPHEKFACLHELFTDFYQQSAERYQKLLLQLNAHLTYNAPLGEDFEIIFG